MKKSTHSSERKKRAAIKRRHNRKQLALHRDHIDAVDRISLLPDDILISVLSRLPLGKAMATSTLSTRWRNLYTHMDRLIFIRPESDLDLPDESSSYLNTISRTLDLCSGNVSLKEFRVNLIASLEGANLERWLEFALARKVEVINIQMTCYECAVCYPYDLQLSNLITANDGACRSLPGFKSLKEFSLCGVHVEDREIGLLLSSFPLLETLSISNCDTLKNISVIGHEGPKLKHFDIASASKLESVEVRDMINLVSLRCYGYQQPDSLRLSSVPKLTELEICLKSDIILPSLPCSILDQLRLLEISTSPTDMMVPPASYQLKNLRQLEISVFLHPGYSNNHLQKVFLQIEPCSSLETLKVNLCWFFQRKENFEIEEIHDLLPARKQLSPNLKNVELDGYLGKTEELEFASLIINNAEALEELTVKPCDETAKIKRMARARAWKQFRSIAAANSLNLVIL